MAANTIQNPLTFLQWYMRRGAKISEYTATYLAEGAGIDLMDEKQPQPIQSRTKYRSSNMFWFVTRVMDH